MNSTARNTGKSPVPEPRNPPDFEPDPAPLGGRGELRAALSSQEPDDTHNPLWTVVVAMGALFAVMATLMALG